MKKTLYSIMFALAIFIGNSYIVDALFDYDKFDYNTCTLDCRNAGSQVVYCKAGCDARNFVKNEMAKCKTQSCKDDLDSAYQLKYNYFIDYHNGYSSDGGFNYSTFDYDTCYSECRNATNQNDCKAVCVARDTTQYCILNAKTQEMVDTCKNNYQSVYLREVNKYNNDSTTNKTEEEVKQEDCANKCSNECADDRDLECYRWCYNDCTEGEVEEDKPVNTYPKINCSGIEVPKKIAQLVSTFINIIKIAVPILIIIYGSLDFAKAVMAQKEDEIKKGQQMFIKRLISGVMVFLVIFIVQIVIGLVAPHNENTSMWDCVDCFINGDC